MMKKFALAIGVAATLGCASAAHAGYYETFNNFRGNFNISGFEPVNNVFDKKFSISLTNLDGTVSLQIPSPGTYGASITPGSSMSIDYTGDSVPDFAIGPVSVAVPIGIGTIYSIGGLDNIKLMNFNFNGTGSSTFTLDTIFGPQLGPVGIAKHVDVSGSGATNFFAALFGIPGFLTGNVSGNMGVDITFNQDKLDFLIDGSGLTGTDLEVALKILDDRPNSLNDGMIDGTFAVNGSVHIPEPGSITLLGIGLFGLAAHRRKARKTA